MSLENVEVESFIKTFLKTKKPSNLRYRNLVAAKSEKPRASQTKWHRHCDLDEEEIDWKKKHISANKNITKSIKLIISNLNFSVDICLQIPFCTRLQLTVMIFAPFARKKQKLCFLAILGDLSVLGKLFSNSYSFVQSCSLIQKGNYLAMTTAFETRMAKIDTLFFTKIATCKKPYPLEPHIPTLYMVHIKDYLPPPPPLIPWVCNTHMQIVTYLKGQRTDHITFCYKENF